MRLKSTYRSERRNEFGAISHDRAWKLSKRRLNPDFKRLDGSNWTKDFSAPIANANLQPRGKSYPYGSTRQGYDAPDIFVDVIPVGDIA